MRDSFGHRIVGDGLFFERYDRIRDVVVVYRSDLGCIVNGRRSTHAFFAHLLFTLTIPPPYANQERRKHRNNKGGNQRVPYANTFEV
jgi:hypothetical protein